MRATTNHRIRWRRGLSSLLLTACLLCSCARQRQRTSLPFLVSFHVEPPAGAGVDESERWRGLAEPIARGLEDFFTDVSHPGDEFAGAVADLDMRIAVEPGGFNAGSMYPTGFILSTTTWLLLGVPAWFIDSQRYDNSDVYWKIDITRPASDTGEETVAIRPGDAFHVNGLPLTFFERSGTTGYLWQLFVPPALLDGDSDRARVRLIESSPELFVTSKAHEIASELARSYFDKQDCFLVYDRVDPVVDDDPGVAILVSNGEVDTVCVRGEEDEAVPARDRDTRAVADGGDKEIASFCDNGFVPLEPERVPDAQLDDVQRAVTRRFPKIAYPGLVYYRLRLSPRDGFVHVKARTVDNRRVGSWTVYVEPGTEPDRGPAAVVAR